MVSPSTPEAMAAALTLYSWALIACLTVMLAAKPYSASRETRGTANMLIRNTLMGRERTGRLNAIAPHTRLRLQARREAPARPPAEAHKSGCARHPPPPAAAGPPGVTEPCLFPLVRLSDRDN